MRRAPTIFALSFLLLVLAVPAFAGVDVDVVAEEVALDGLYVEPGLSADTSALNAAIVRAGNEGVRLMVVLLDDDPTGGAATFADAVLDRGPRGTVLGASVSYDAAPVEFVYRGRVTLELAPRRWVAVGNQSRGVHPPAASSRWSDTQSGRPGFDAPLGPARVFSKKPLPGVEGIATDPAPC